MKQIIWIKKFEKEGCETRMVNGFQFICDFWLIGISCLRLGVNKCECMSKLRESYVYKVASCWTQPFCQQKDRYVFGGDHWMNKIQGDFVWVKKQRCLNWSTLSHLPQIVAHLDDHTVSWPQSPVLCEKAKFECHGFFGLIGNIYTRLSDGWLITMVATNT